MKTLALSILVGLLAAPASALELMIKNVRTPASTVTANIEVRDVLPDRFKRLIDDGGVLHLRVEAELWESRPVWDRLRDCPRVSTRTRGAGARDLGQRFRRIDADVSHGAESIAGRD